jgi:RNA polymerase sigma-70 factor, ECF subfamily
MADGAPALREAEGLSDDDIVERVLAGDTALYEVVMRRHNTRLYRTARAILGSDVDVEDVMQNAYVRAFQHLAQFERRSKFSTWLTRIAVHEALARKRKAERTEDWDAMSTSRRDMIMASRERPDPEKQAASGELNRLIEHSIESLPETYRMVVMLRDVEEMSTAETAECLSLTEDNVKVRLHRAHAMLRKELYARARVSAGEAFPFHAVRCDRVVSGVYARLATMRPECGSPPGR